MKIWIAAVFLKIITWFLGKLDDISNTYYLAFLFLFVPAWTTVLLILTVAYLADCIVQVFKAMFNKFEPWFDLRTWGSFKDIYTFPESPLLNLRYSKWLEWRARNLLQDMLK